MGRPPVSLSQGRVLTPAPSLTAGTVALPRPALALAGLAQHIRWEKQKAAWGTAALALDHPLGPLASIAPGASLPHTHPSSVSTKAASAHGGLYARSSHLDAEDRGLRGSYTSCQMSHILKSNPQDKVASWDQSSGHLAERG